MKKRNSTNNLEIPPHKRTIAPSAAHMYIGNLSLAEFDTIDLFMIERKAMGSHQISERMGVKRDTVTKRLTFFGKAGLGVVVFDGMRQGEMWQEIESSPVFGSAPLEDTRRDRVNEENKWLPTPYAYDQWHLALGEDPNDPRYQHNYRTLESLRAVWEAGYAESVRQCNAFAPAWKKRRATDRRTHNVRNRNVLLGSSEKDGGVYARDM